MTTFNEWLDHFTGTTPTKPVEQQQHEQQLRDQFDRGDSRVEYPQSVEAFSERWI